MIAALTRTQRVIANEFWRVIRADFGSSAEVDIRFAIQRVEGFLFPDGEECDVTGRPIMPPACPIKNPRLKCETA